MQALQGTNSELVQRCLMREGHACDSHNLVPVALADGLVRQLLEQRQLLQKVINCPLAVYICLPLPQ